MSNTIKSQIQSLKPSQNDNEASIHQERIVNVLGVAGSMRQGFYSTLALKMVASRLEEAKKYDSEPHVLELRKMNLPIYDPSGTTSVQPYSNNNSNNDLERITSNLKWAEMTAILREAWTTLRLTEDKREKIQALSLGKECYSTKLRQIIIQL